MGASTLVWSTWWLREENGVGVSIQECEEGPGGQKEQHPPRKDKGALPCQMLVREGCFIFRGFGRSGIGEEESTRRKMGREKRRFAGTIRNRRHICRLQEETEHSRGVVP